MRSAVVAFVIAIGVFIMLVGAGVHAGRNSIRTAVANERPGDSDNDETKSLTPTVGTFHIVNANGPINVHVTVGDKPSLTFQARADVLPLLTSEVKDGVLTIGMNIHQMNDIGDITATIVTPSIDGVTLNGSGNVEVEGVKSTDFSAMLNGSGNLSAKGSADAATFTVDGSGNIEADDLLSSATTVKIAGSGNANVNASKKLEATIAGSGDIRFTGNPGTVNRSVFGSGSVEAE